VLHITLLPSPLTPYTLASVVVKYTLPFTSLAKNADTIPAELGAVHDHPTDPLDIDSLYSLAPLYATMLPPPITTAVDDTAPPNDCFQLVLPFCASTAYMYPSSQPTYTVPILPVPVRCVDSMGEDRMELPSFNDHTAVPFDVRIAYSL